MIKDKFYTPFSWIMIAVILVITLSPLFKINIPAQMVFVCAIPLVLVHSVKRYGYKGMAFFVVITYILSSLWENLSIWTGFPFGDYHYTGTPKILEVPLIIGPAYISLGYISMQVANSILQQADTRAKKLSSVIVLSILSGIIMTVFDLATDAKASTINGVWIWENGGSFFGVPVSNFLGWWFCTITFYLLFSFYIHKNPTLVQKEKTNTSLLQFIIIYVCLGTTVIVERFMGTDMSKTVTDKAGTIWKLADLNGSAILWVVFGMFSLAFLAIVNLFRIGLSKSLETND